MIKLSDYVMKFIEEQGVKHIFLIPSGGCMHLIDSVGRSNITPICCLHEQTAVIAADAYSQYNQNLGVALVTTGPGATNAITGVAGAWKDSTPLLVISGQVKTTDMINGSGVRQMGMQEVDIISMVSSITKYAVTIINPTSIKYHLERAIYLAKTGRKGPVWLNIPLDVQGTWINEKEIRGFTPTEIDNGDDELRLQFQIKETVSLIHNSKRPVLLIGNGARNSPYLLKFIEMLRIPVLTTWKAIDLIPELNTLYFGRPGIIGQRAANFIQQNADLIITVGARFGFGQIGYNHSNFAPNAKKVIVDIDKHEISKLNTYINVPIHTDASTFIKLLMISIKYAEFHIKWFDQCNEWYNKYNTEISVETKFINTYNLINTISELSSSDDVIVPDSAGSAAEITLQTFKVKEGQRIIFNPGLGSMGYGLPSALGAAICSGKRVISIIGDGSLQHNIQELETLRRLNLPVKIFVLNNNGYASIKHTHNTHFNGKLVCCDPSSGLTFPDTCKISLAYDIATLKLERKIDLRRVVKKVLEYDGPVICEVIVDPLLQTLPRMSSKVLDNDSIVSAPFENIYPFLHREEFEENMLIINKKV